MDATEKLLKELTEASGVSGYEAEVRGVVRRYFEPLGEITQDKIGSLICQERGGADRPRVALAGHMDEVGFMVKLIKTKVEWEGNVYERNSITEGEEPEAWTADTALKLAGRGQPRIDGPERVTGRAKYTFDIQLPGMLYARVLRSPHPHAHIKRLGVSRAAEVALEGVKPLGRNHYKIALVKGMVTEALSTI